MSFRARAVDERFLFSTTGISSSSRIDNTNESTVSSITTPIWRHTTTQQEQQSKLIQIPKAPSSLSSSSSACRNVNKKKNILSLQTSNNTTTTTTTTTTIPKQRIESVPTLLYQKRRPMNYNNKKQAERLYAIDKKREPTTEDSLLLEKSTCSVNEYNMRSLDDFLEVAAASSKRTRTISNSYNNNNNNINVNNSRRRRRRNPFDTVNTYNDIDDTDSIDANEYDEHETPATGNTNSNCCNDGGLCTKQWRYAIVFISLGIANSADASEILCLSYILSDKTFQKQLLQESAFRSGLLAATVFWGMLIGGLIVGCFGDWYGRRPLLQIGLLTCSITGFLSAICPDVWTLTLCRFFAGLGIGATVPPLFALCTELSPPSERGFWVTVAASFWMVGSIYVSILGWIVLGGLIQDQTHPEIPNIDFMKSSPSETETETENSLILGISPWRIFAALCALPSSLAFILVQLYVPESPRFLLLQDRHEEALSILYYLAVKCLNYQGPPITIDELRYQYPPTTPQIATVLPNSSPQSVVSTKIPNQSCEDQTTVLVTASLPSSTTSPRSNDGINRSTIVPSTSPSYLQQVQLALVEFKLSTSRLYGKGLFSTTWPLQVVWFSLSFGSYGLLTWINTLFERVHLQNVYFNALLFSLSNLPGNAISAYLMDKVGRSKILTGSLLLAALSLVSFAHEASSTTTDDGYNNNNTGGNGNSTRMMMQQHLRYEESDTSQSMSRTLIVLSACAFQCFTVAAWNSIDVLTSELFPTSVRATGMGVCAATGRVGAMVAQFVNGWLVSNPSRLLLVAAGTLALGSITPMFLPADQTGQSVQDHYETSTTGTSSTTAPSNTTRTSRSGISRINNENDNVQDEESELV